MLLVSVYLILLFPLIVISFSPSVFFISLCVAESFNDWGGRGSRKFVPFLGEDGTKTAPPGDIIDQPPGEMRRIRGNLADHIEGHAVLSPEGAVLMITPGTESSYPRPPQSLNDSASVALDLVFMPGLYSTL